MSKEYRRITYSVYGLSIYVRDISPTFFIAYHPYDEHTERYPYAFVNQERTYIGNTDMQFWGLAGDHRIAFDDCETQEECMEAYERILSSLPMKENE